ncbi:uncharacterized protein [Littorina saxatilis]|uniref:Uncharacterized protein n=1 Tax=Littorina saxatilis TaxID=31220 RepID=A0AAN9G006_9CAEN
MPAFVKIAGQLSAGVRREFLSPNKVRLTLSWGFPYEAFGPSATVKPWHILNLVESGRALSFNSLPNQPEQSLFLCVQDLYSHYGLFQGSVKLNISKELYDISIPKTPLVLEKELVYVGKSSMNLHTDVILPSKSLTLASCEVQSVLVDRETRRPAPHPDWWREKFGQYTDATKQLKVNVRKEPEEDTIRGGEFESKDNTSHKLNNGEFTAKDQKLTDQNSNSSLHVPDLLPLSERVTSYNLTVCESDSDSYGHANWSVYLKYCLDALVMGSPETSKELKRRAVKSAEISYISEGSVGQEVCVKFWEDEVVPRGVHFHIIGCDSKQLMNYVFVQFYSLEDVELMLSKL